VGALLALLGGAHWAWCSWSLPIHGVASPHGLETAACNWGMSMMVVLNIGLGVALLALGLLALWQRAVRWRWWTCQLAIGSVIGYVVLLLFV
jgi:hypothetical protein